MAFGVKAALKMNPEDVQTIAKRGEIPAHEEVRTLLLAGKPLHFNKALPSKDRTVEAQCIREAVEAGASVDISHAVIVGELNLSNINLPLTPLEKANLPPEVTQAYKNMGTKEVKIIGKPLKVANSEIQGKLTALALVFTSTVCFEESEFKVGPNFSFVVFTGDVTFSGTNFGGEGGTNFSSVTFSGKGTTNFTRASFSTMGGADLSKTIFGSEGGADFSWAKFSCKTGTDFSWTRLSGKETSFFRATFGGGGIDFSWTRFESEKTVFSGANFSGEGMSYFFDATFSGEIDFSKATFNDKEGTDFSKATFSGQGANFSEATFSGQGGANFSQTKFSSERSNFLGTTFGGKRTTFTKASFSHGELDFSNSNLCSEDGTDFSAVVFGGKKTTFAMATFGGLKADFSRAIFSGEGTVDFSKTLFNCEAIFSSTTFLPSKELCQEVATALTGAEPEKIASFFEARELGTKLILKTMEAPGQNAIVDFRQAKFQEQLDLRGAKLLNHLSFDKVILGFDKEVVMEGAEFWHRRLVKRGKWFKKVLTLDRYPAGQLTGGSALCKKLDTSKVLSIAFSWDDCAFQSRLSDMKWEQIAVPFNREYVNLGKDPSDREKWQEKGKKMREVYTYLQDKFTEIGRYDDTKNVYYERKVLERTHYSRHFHWLLNLIFFCAFCGYGVRFYRVLLASLGLIALFTLIYFIPSMIGKGHFIEITEHGQEVVAPEEVTNPVSSTNNNDVEKLLVKRPWWSKLWYTFYLSVFTFTGMGTERVVAKGPLGVAALVESAMGWFMLGLFLFTMTEAYFR